MVEHGQRPRTATLPLWRRLGWRLAASVLLLTALGILVSGSLQYRAQERWLRESLGELLLNIARTGALVVDGDLHRAGPRRARVPPGAGDPACAETGSRRGEAVLYGHLYELERLFYYCLGP